MKIKFMDKVWAKTTQPSELVKMLIEIIENVQLKFVAGTLRFLNVF